MPWEIARSSRPIIELLPIVIRRPTVQKNCQKGVNTRENALRLRAVYLYHETAMNPQSIVLSRSFSCSSLLLPEVSQTCSQLIHTRFVVVLASWLETRNQLQKRQEKNEFNFQLRQKNFLDWKNEARVSMLKRKHCVEKISFNPNRYRSESARRTDFAADWLTIPS